MPGAAAPSPQSGLQHPCLTVALAAPQTGRQGHPPFFPHPGNRHGALTETEAQDTHDERTHDHG